ncbi:MNIO family bufferin maturase [Aliiroseovarius marinus]|uniref:MNIO family bufferin maturase n=1 Tax=Aliiroseovarius marinus TaxID=2500159 RepID=UPI003D7E4A23
MPELHHHNTLPAGAGVGYKPQHFQSLLDQPGAVSWLEIHAENYMIDGGRQLAQLRHLAEHFPISVHGVGASIGGEGRLDPEHMARLKTLVDWLNPAMFSEHLAWSTHDSAFLNDLLPVPYTNETLTRVVAHINEAQDLLGRKMLLENPSSYLAFAESTWSEPDFIREVARRTGCGLLLDVNNVFISATNLAFEALEYLDAYPLALVEEIHLAGHDEDADELGRKLLIDSHGKPVDEPVWALFDHVISRTGPRPALIEWDNDVPDWPVLEAEAARATEQMKRAAQKVPA